MFAVTLPEVAPNRMMLGAAQLVDVRQSGVGSYLAWAQSADCTAMTESTSTTSTNSGALVSVVR